MIRLALVALLVAGCSAAPGIRPAVEINGTSATAKLVDLGPGYYETGWTSRGSCSFMVTLTPQSSTAGEAITIAAGEDTVGAGDIGGADLTGGQYVLGVAADGCAWKVTITPA